VALKSDMQKLTTNIVHLCMLFNYF